MSRSNGILGVGVAALLVVTAAMASAASPSPAPDATFEFVRVADLAEPRIHPAAVLLADGRVLVAGGYDTRAAEIWDPATGEWDPAGISDVAREGGRADLLADGRVVISGGCCIGESDEAPPAEVWDPATGTFAPAGPLADQLPEPELVSPGVAARDGASQTTLPDGRVLVAGGRGPSVPTNQAAVRKSGPILAQAELVDPSTGTIVALPDLNVPRTEHAAILLADGRILLVGSHAHGREDRTAEIFQPVP